MNPILKDLLKKCDVLLISSRGNIIYFTSYSNFSETERECFLLITHSKQYLITDKRYSDALLQIAKDFEVMDTGALRFITKDAKDFFEKEKIKTVGFEDYDLTVSEHSKLKRIASTRPIDLRNPRIIKQEHEIENIKNACIIGDKAFSFIIKQIKVGITEQELAFALENYVKQKGADFSFKPIVAFGKNSSIPHHMTGKNKLKRNQIVLLDFGVKVNNYCSDMTRTVFFGKADEKFKKIHKTVLEAQQKAIHYINNFYSSSEERRNREVSSRLRSNNNLLARDIDKIARDYIVKQGYPTIPHSLGHGVGIEVHESPHLSPNSKDKIKKGMVFSVEPGIYIPGFGGIRIEDLVLVTKNGAELISHANREIIEI